VQLDEGPLLVSNLVGEENPHIELDAKVKVMFRDTPEDFNLPQFVLTGTETEA